MAERRGGTQKPNGNGNGKAKAPPTRSSSSDVDHDQSPSAARASTLEYPPATAGEAQMKTLASAPKETASNTTQECKPYKCIVEPYKYYRASKVRQSVRF